MTWLNYFKGLFFIPELNILQVKGEKKLKKLFKSKVLAKSANTCHELYVTAHGHIQP